MALKILQKKPKNKKQSKNTEASQRYTAREKEYGHPLLRQDTV